MVFKRQCVDTLLFWSDIMWVCFHEVMVCLQSLSATCSCCCRASSICCCCFSSSKAAMFLCSEWAPSSCSLRPVSWLIIINNWSSFSARASGVPAGVRGAGFSKKTAQEQTVYFRVNCVMISVGWNGISIKFNILQLILQFQSSYSSYL